MCILYIYIYKIHVVWYRKYDSSLEAATPPAASRGHLLGEYHLPKEALTGLAEIFLGLVARRNDLKGLGKIKGR